ncbi:hypothetical protein JMN32_12250 [Fulvivirga sp. 29W222]|uniref:Uncharacterized protein n=1 Tax=Fulvivirga marina TaxID=2494733 RepID=A0A937FW58_9BACT|nr:hypothetical protein [Fulvivirga marina]MBL6447084.1 hypothetical protein [Fulvivirga marina]
MRRIAKTQLLSLLSALFFNPLIGTAQNDTEIYVFDLSHDGTDYSISDPFNVTYQNVGYDNQPHFLSDGSMYYVSTRNSQTDIAQVEFQEYSWSWLTWTEGGSEYSPTPIPNSQDFSYIRLDTNGLQLLYRHFQDTQESQVLIKDLKIGYHCWFDENILAVFVLGEPPTLQICNLAKDECSPKHSNIGRSLHRIPNTSSISFISKEQAPWQIKSFEPVAGTTRKIINVVNGSEDMCWAPDGTMFMGSDSTLYKFHAAFDRDWVKVADLSEFGLSGITRLTINPDGNQIAIVVNQSPSTD